MLSTITHGLVANVPQKISDPEINPSERGWDSYRQNFLIQLDGFSISEALDNHFVTWSPHESHSQLFQLPAKPTNVGGGVWEIEVEWQGIFQPRGFRRQVKCFGENSNGENVFLTSNIQALGYPAFVAKLKLEQVTISVETTYISSTLPSLIDVKHPIDTGDFPSGFPGLPTAPVSFWLHITDPTYVYPSGWILDDRAPKQLGAAPLYEITDRHVFRHILEM